MSRLAEILTFASLAAGLHVGAWFLISEPGAESAGAGGEAAVSLTAASGEMAQLVAAWVSPTDVMQTATEALPQQRVEETPIPAVAIITEPARAGQPKQPDALAMDTTPDKPTAAAKPPAIRSASLKSPVTPKVPSDVDPPVIRDMSSRPRATPSLMAALPMPSSPTDALPEIDTIPAERALVVEPPSVSLRPVARPAQPSEVVKAKPKPQNNAPSKAVTNKPAAKAQAAAGNKNGKNAGTKDDKGPSGLSKAARQSLIAKWGASIRNSVERRKRYPRGAQTSGTTILRITVSPKGRLVSVKISKSSGDRKLDNAAVDAVRRTRFRAAPKGLTEAAYRFNLPLAFTAL